MRFAARSASSGSALAIIAAATSVVVSATPRVLLAAGWLPPSARPFIWSDVLATYLDRLAGGRMPYADTFFDYPPGIGYVAGILARLAGGAVAYTVVWTAISVLGAAVIAALMVRAAPTGRTIVFWSASPQLLLYGGANFDVVPLLLLVVAVVIARRGHAFATISLLALGTLTKIFPAVSVPLELERVRRRSGIRAALIAAAVFILIVLVVALPSIVAPYPSTDSVLFQAVRTNFDSIWGLVIGALGLLGVPNAQAIVGWLSLLGLAVMYFVVLRSADPRADPALLTLQGLLVLLLWTRLYSPQYSLWVLPFLALCNVPVGPFVLLSIADIMLFVTIYPLTLVPWSAADPLPTFLLGAFAIGVVLRHVALIAMWSAARRSR